MNVKNKSVFINLTQLIAQDKTFLFTMTSYTSILAIFLNLSTVQSPIIGIAASIIYLLINATFIGQALFQNENLFTRFLLGTMLLIVILGLVGLAIMILHNLDSVGTAVVLSITTLFASLLNRKVKPKNAT